MSEPKPVIRDVVTPTSSATLKEFADFWYGPDQQSELIERYGTPSDREFWRNRNER